MNLILPLRVLLERWRLERSCRWPRARLALHQSRSLGRLRRFVLSHSPFYRRFHHGLEQRPLAELPILSKAEIMENFDGLVTDRRVRLADVEAFLEQGGGRGLYRGRYVVLSTSGTTGRRGLFLFDRGEWINVLASISRPLYWAGIYQRPWGLPRVALIASTVPWHYSARISLTLSSRWLPQLRLDAVQPVAEMVERLNDWQPEVLAAYPSVVLQLAEEQIAGRLRIQPANVMTSAEVLPEETRRRVREAWGVRMFDTYGTTEYAPVAVECLYGRKHLLEDGAIIEILDERGRVVPPGEAGDRIAITVFRRRVQPLIRYEISDMVRPQEVQCECGRPFRVIDAVEGRTEDVLWFPARNGERPAVPVHPNVFHDVLDVFPSSGWQVVQDQRGLTVNLCVLRDPAGLEPLRLALYRALDAQEVRVPAIEIQPVDKLDRGATAKAPLVFSKLARVQA